MKAIAIVAIISIVACNASIVVIKGDNNDVRKQQKMDSVQLQKNDFKLPNRWNL